MKTLANFYSFLILPIDELDPEKGKILWLIRLRWIFLFIQFVIVIPFLMSNVTYFREMSFYVGLCAVLTVFNAIMYGVWKNSDKVFSTYLTFFCLTVDLVWFTLLFWFLVKVIQIHAENIYFIHAALGAILLSGKKSLFFYFLIAFSFFLIQLEFGAVSFFNQAILFCVWVITRSVSRYVFSQREQLSQMKIYAEKMDRLRAIGALTAGFSHEFASPLNTIKLRLNRIVRKDIDVNEDAEAALLAVESCEKIIRHINHAQMDKRDFIFQTVNLKTSLNEIVESWKMDHVDAKIEVSFSANFPAKIRIPIINLSQGLLNIIDNAYESDANNKIVIDISIIEGRLVVCILDDGDGFSKNILERFGEPFVTTKKEGTGLGLYSFLVFAQSMGGSVSIGNLKPKGAMVKFVSPLHT
jgi:two-component system sensor histidine kinase RegB